MKATPILIQVLVVVHCSLDALSGRPGHETLFFRVPTTCRILGTG